MYKVKRRKWGTAFKSANLRNGQISAICTFVQMHTTCQFCLVIIDGKKWLCFTN